MLKEGWYLMTTAELEAELPFIDDAETSGPVTGAVPVDVETALAIKRSGNIPDPEGRTLRLVLRAAGTDPEAIARRRMEFEPNYHEAPSWRRPGSKPINVIPLRARDTNNKAEAWWEDPTMGELEAEWRRLGSVAGVKVPAEYRSFVFKTVVALRAGGKEVDAASIADSIARWVTPEDAKRIRSALLQANP